MELAPVKWLPILFGVILEKSFAFTCSNKCSAQDDDLSCWNETRQYYGETMVESIQDYIVARLQFIVSTHPQQPWNEDQMASHNWKQNVDNSGFKVLDESHFLQMMSDVAQQISVVNRTMSPAEILSLNYTACEEAPCDKTPEPMTGLFGASLALNFVLILAAIVYFVIQEDWNNPKSFLKRKDIRIPSWNLGPN